MSFHLLFPHGGDTTPIPSHRNQKIHETRNPSNPSPASLPNYTPINFTQSDFLYLAEIKSQAQKAIHTSRNLSNRLAAVRAKLLSHLDEECNVPPDPGPQITPEYSIAAVKRRIDGEEESAPTALVVEKELRPITGIISRSNDTILMVGKGAILEDAGEKKNPPPSIEPFFQFPPTNTRCLQNCLMENNDAILHAGGGPEANFRKRAGKEIAGSCSGERKNILVINMSKARHAVRARFLAVGLFLSVLLANSQQVIEQMKKVWKVRGRMEANPLETEEGRKFILEFSEEGDRDHVIRGGPWQHKGDAFLVECLEVGDDPLSVLFTHVPMWVQFRNIPDYLLTKKLAHDLGERVGTTRKIDNMARRNIDEKFIRTRVQLPLYIPLQKEITLAYRITEEKVEVQLRYERLPNFCLFCGYIGHMEARCDTPAADRMLCFRQELRVPPVYFDDLRAWYLPDEMGKSYPQPASSGPWRAPKPAYWSEAASSAQPAVEGVLEHVARLRVDDINDNIVPADRALSDVAHDINTGAAAAVQDDTTNIVAPNINTGATVAGYNNMNNTNITGGEGVEDIDADNGTATPTVNHKATQAGPNTSGAKVAVAPIALVEDKEDADQSTTPASANSSNAKGWKRKKREGVVDQNSSISDPSANLRNRAMGRVRQRPEEDTGEKDMMQHAKRGYFQAPTLSECLGKEGLRMLREAKLDNAPNKYAMFQGADQEEGVGSDDSASKEEKEATGPGATGPLSGADESAWQEQ